MGGTSEDGEALLLDRFFGLNLLQLFYDFAFIARELCWDFNPDVNLHNQLPVTSCTQNSLHSLYTTADMRIAQNQTSPGTLKTDSNCLVNLVH